MKNTRRRTSAINPVTMENYPSNVGKLSGGATANRYLTLSAKIYETQRRTLLQYTKSTGRADATKKIKPVAFAIIKLCLSEGISLSGQSVKDNQWKILHKRFLKFCSNLLEVFQVILKELLGLVIPNQYCQGVAGFRVTFLSEKPIPNIQYYHTV